MKTIHLHLESIKTKEELHNIFKQELGLAGHYGENLDALYDCLMELYAPVKIVIFSKFPAELPLGNYARQLVTMLQEAADENMAIRLSLLEQEGK